MNLIRVGKVKEVYEVDEEYLMFVFTDNISVFDKIIPTSIPYKGESLCRTSEYWFETLEDMGIKTHYSERLEKNKMKVKRVDVLDKPTQKDKNYLIPLEFIVRHYVAGSIYDRIKSGKISPQELGLNNVVYGERLPEPYFEVTTKFEEYDRNIDFEEAMEIGGVTKSEMMDIKELILKIDDRIEKEVKKRGLIHVDGKEEFAFDSKREIMIVDTFGTADEDRWWDLKEYEKYVEGLDI